MRLAQPPEERVEDVLHALAARERELEDVLELRAPDDDGGGAGEPAQHGVRQEARDELELQEAHARLEQPDDQRQRRREALIPHGILGGVLDLGNARARQERHHGDGADGELARRAEERVDEDGHDAAVEADLGRELRERGVRHALRNHHDRDGQARNDVALDVVPGQALDDADEGKELIDGVGDVGLDDGLDGVRVEDVGRHRADESVLTGVAL